ncbi:YARHG domain-containing protein [Faecalimonas umbilicata]|uniref:YARHG domain-containing protein n=1 Tax=Faecalimonas umbilicata TaxID=1912855 RepID=UPI002A7FBA8B|nr:YARHG domain-containing protein [Faecalimonas umbilicata]MDY4596760.1 YARHG domain-containing protein [Faecalimonas umbilicata]
MYCKYCGRKIQEGEICNCRSQNDSVRESGSQKNKQESEQPKKQKERPKKEKQSQSKKNGSWNKTPLVIAVVFLALAAVSFISLRFLLADTLSGGALEEIYPYLIYILPSAFAVIAAVAAVFGMSGRGKWIATAMTVVSVLGIAGIMGSMILAPYESSSGSVADYEKDDENDSVRVEKGEKKDEVSGQLEEIREDFEDGKLDYVEAKKELEEIDVDDLEQTQEKKYDSLVEDLGKGLEKEISEYTKISNYKYAIKHLTSISEELDEEDEVVNKLLKQCDVDYMKYLEEESSRLIAEGTPKDAVQILEDAKELVRDQEKLEKLIATAEKAEADKKNAVAKKDSEYIIPDSNSRYLTESDISGLSLQQLNYAKNEIYARRGRKFDSVELQEYFGSKSWYRGTIEPSQFTNDMLNDYEIKNADLLSAREFAIDSGGYKLR